MRTTKAGGQNAEKYSSSVMIAAVKVCGVPVDCIYDVRSENAIVMVINICDFDDTHPEILEDVYEDNSVFLEWLNANDATYYAAPREDFHVNNGVQKAIDEGKSVVIVEDLS